MMLVYTGIAMQEVLGTNYRVAYLAATFGATLLCMHYSEFSQLQMDEELIEQQVKLSNDPLTGYLAVLLMSMLQILIQYEQKKEYYRISGYDRRNR